jgi:mRNA interferase RelE/StbE
MKYQVEVVASAKKSLKNIEPKYVKKIIQRIERLQIDPRHHGSTKLSGQENTYRTRIGKYRIIYEIYNSKVLVLIVYIAHRKDIYR